MERRRVIPTKDFKRKYYPHTRTAAEVAEAKAAIVDGDTCATCEAPREPRLFHVAVYFVTLAFGGSEEGGWWFDSGAPSLDHEQFTRLFRQTAAAQRYRDRLDRVLIKRLNKGRRDYRSVLGHGEFRAIWDDGLPKPFPAELPRYE